MAKDPGSPASKFNAAIFLDSEDLTNLAYLRDRVRNTHNLVLLLTRNVFSRPWVLIEIVTAIEAGVRVIPVQLLKGSVNDFEFPDAAFFESLKDGSLLQKSGCEVLQDVGISLDQVVSAIQELLNRIAIPYSPHRQGSIRRSELKSLMKQCILKRPFRRTARVDTGGESNIMKAHYTTQTIRTRPDTDRAAARHSIEWERGETARTDAFATLPLPAHDPRSEIWSEVPSPNTDRDAMEVTRTQTFKRYQRSVATKEGAGLETFKESADVLPVKLELETM